jgi:signal transduction histidine kinase
VVSVGRALFRDPFLDPNCWSNCTDNVFLVHADQGLVGVLDDLWLGFSAAAGVLLAAFACRRLVSATRPGRAALWTVLVPAALAAAAEAAYAIALLRDPVEDPEGAVFHAIFLARALSFACLAGGVAWIVVRSRRTRAAIARLASDLGEAPQPGSLQAALARSLGDDELEVAYAIPGSRRYVDAEGRPVDTHVGTGRATTPIVRNGEPVALVTHDRALLGARELERDIGAGTRLAVDNERLRAEVLAQLEDLRSSRARVVEAGDSARRRIERDLHDGAQQRLLTLSYELRMARATADAEGDVDLEAPLAWMLEEVRAALAELRELAHGIYPAVLAESGFGPALWTLADGAPLPVEVEALDEERYPPAVETALYLAVEEAVADAARRGATYARVRIVRDGRVLSAEVTDDGAARAAGVMAAEDRVGALGGRIEVGPATLRAMVPCA